MESNVLKMITKKVAVHATALLTVVAGGMLAPAQATVWVGGNGNWSSDGNPGWNGAGVPNAQGAVAEYLGGSSVTTTQDIVAGVTVGTIRNGGTGNASWTVSGGLINMDQDGSGGGFALIENSKTASGGHRLNVSYGTLNLVDDTIFRNTSNSVSTSGSILVQSIITGTQDVIIDNQNSNNVGVGQIRFTRANTYTGNTNVSVGALELDSTGETRFLIQDGGLSNSIFGSGSVLVEGMFRLDITGLTQSVGVWNLLNTSTLTESWNNATFSLRFTNNTIFDDMGGGIYTSGDWTFDQSTGNLTLGAIPEPGTVGLLGLGSMLVLLRRRRMAA